MEATEVLAPAQNGPASRAGQLLNALIELDFTRPLAFIALATVFVGVRIPWLDLGYGTDPDAWRVALTASYLWEEGDYFPSRLPGYPLHELVTAALVRYGWVWTNLSTVLISLVGVYLFAWIARKLDLGNRGALTIAFAFTPLLWINSVMTMDYMWALTFILAAYLAIIYRSPTLAGISLGIAAGFRLTSLGMLVPFWLLLLRSDRRDELRPLTATALAAAFVAYTPVIMVYGLNLLNFYDQAVPIGEFLKRLGKDAMGIVGALVVLIALALSFGRLRRLPGDLVRDAHVLTWVAVVVVYFFSYTRLPHEIAYLIPVFPFAYFLLSRYLSRGLLVAVLSVIVVTGFVDITSPGDTIGLDAATFTGAGIGKGMLLSDIETLNNQLDFARELREVSIREAKSGRQNVVMMGFIYPEFVMLYQDELSIGILEEDREAISQLSDKGLAVDEERRIQYVWLLEFDREPCVCGFKQYWEDDSPIWFTADAARSTFAVYGYRPGYWDEVQGGKVKELPLSRDNPSLGEGTAATDR